MQIKVPVKTLMISAVTVIVLFLPWILNQYFGMFSEGPLMPVSETNIIIQSNDISPNDTNPSSYIKKLIRLFNSIDYGEPSFLLTVFPIGAFLAGVAGLYFGKWPKNWINSPHITQRKYVFFLIYFITIAAFFTGVSIEVVGNIGLKKQRYYMYLLPAIALLSGIGFSKIYDEVLSKPKYSIVYLIFIIFTFSLLARATVTIYANSKRPLIKMHSSPLHDDLVTLAKDINNTFGFGSKKIMYRTSYILTDGADWYSKIQPIQYLLDHLNLQDKKNTYSGCIFVVGRPADLTIQLPFGENVVRDAIAKLPLMRNQGTLIGNSNHDPRFSKAIIIDTLLIRPKYALIGASLPFTDCPKSFMNPYIHYEEEIETEKKLGSHQKNTILNSENNKFFIRQIDAHSNLSINLMIKLQKINSFSVGVEIHSKQLRNSGSYLDGYYAARSIHNPTLIFTNTTTGQIYKKVIFPQKLGHGPYTTPWHATFKHIPSGVYNIEFSSFNNSKTDKTEQKFLLTDNYSVN